MDGSNLVLQMIRASYKKLSKSGQRIADYVLESYDGLSGTSTKQIAEATHTSPASVVRFCRQIGFCGFAEFKARMEVELLEYGIVSYSKAASATIKGNIMKQLRFHQEAIEGLKYTLNEEALMKAVEMIREAETVLIVGDGGSGCSARFAFEMLQRLRINCKFVSDPFHQLIAIENLKPTDALLIICNTGRARNSIENVRIAKELGKRTIGIVGMLNTPIVKYLDVAIATNLYEGDLFSTTITSHICEICTVSVLSMLYALGNPEIEVYTNTKLIGLFDNKRVQPGEEV